MGPVTRCVACLVYVRFSVYYHPSFLPSSLLTFFHFLRSSILLFISCVIRVAFIFAPLWSSFPSWLRSLRSKFQSCSCVVPSVFVLSPSCCSSFCVMFPLETVIPWELLAGVVYLRIVLFVEETPSIPLCFWKQTVQEKQQCGSFSVCFPHRSTAAVQTTLVTPVARHSWTISRLIFCVVQVVTDIPASGIGEICTGVPSGLNEKALDRTV